MKGFKINGVTVKSGERKDIRLEFSETYFGDKVSIPLHVICGKKEGPKLLVTAAIHGDELNGVGIIHELLFGERVVNLEKGVLVLVPVVNVFGFENTERYLPDRRDLNRIFPGFEEGSLGARLAYVVMSELADQCDYAIDLHTAAPPRTNFPNVRGNMKLPEVKKLAKAFGCELIVDGKGPEGSFRNEACKRGCATIILEAGEPWKIEPAILKLGVRGVENVLRTLGMVKGEIAKPVYQTIIHKTTWVRSEDGGILKFHVAPGELVKKGQALASVRNIMGARQGMLRSPVEGIVLGMTLRPTVKPGEPVCQLAHPSRSLASIEKAMDHYSSTSLHEKARQDLATSVVVEPVEKNIGRIRRKKSK